MVISRHSLRPNLQGEKAPTIIIHIIFSINTNCLDCFSHLYFLKMLVVFLLLVSDNQQCLLVSRVHHNSNSRLKYYLTSHVATVCSLLGSVTYFSGNRRWYAGTQDTVSLGQMVFQGQHYLLCLKVASPGSRTEAFHTVFHLILLTRDDRYWTCGLLQENQMTWH